MQADEHRSRRTTGTLEEVRARLRQRSTPEAELVKKSLGEKVDGVVEFVRGVKDSLEQPTPETALRAPGKGNATGAKAIRETAHDAHVRARTELARRVFEKWRDNSGWGAGTAWTRMSYDDRMKVAWDSCLREVGRPSTWERWSAVLTRHDPKQKSVPAAIVKSIYAETTSRVREAVRDEARVSKSASDWTRFADLVIERMARWYRPW